ncbi:OmpW/AlkL family protein [Pseudacidovorax intermedius]|uniref:Membrane protein n=1 Tax=Pseudacidovorax intermedius TaxID=433924 RepID=A0A147H4G2_9BURK|nr:OmpW family outer membrane protein [Pseudacidovorax intermedius]KTT24834.1 membrane protein [Pseudacidovorax intermedius]
MSRLFALRGTSLLLAALLSGGALAQSASAPEGPWLVRARAVRLDPADKSSAIPSLLVPADAIHVDAKTIPELDVSYFFTPNIAAELVLTVPQKQRVTVQQSALGGPVDIGSFKHLPPTLMLQYHFLPEGTFRPYAGVGLNYTRIGSVNLNVPTVGALSLDRSSVGLALGAGLDIKLAPQWFLNVDVKKVKIDSDVRLGWQTVSKVKIDPWLVGVGIGYRF